MGCQHTPPHPITLCVSPPQCSQGWGGDTEGLWGGGGMALRVAAPFLSPCAPPLSVLRGRGLWGGTQRGHGGGYRGVMGRLGAASTPPAVTLSVPPRVGQGHGGASGRTRRGRGRVMGDWGVPLTPPPQCPQEQGRVTERLQGDMEGLGGGTRMTKRGLGDASASPLSPAVPPSVPRSGVGTWRGYKGTQKGHPGAVGGTWRGRGGVLGVTVAIPSPHVTPSMFLGVPRSGVGTQREHGGVLAVTVPPLSPRMCVPWCPQEWGRDTEGLWGDTKGTWRGGGPRGASNLLSPPCVPPSVPRAGWGRGGAAVGHRGATRGCRRATGGRGADPGRSYGGTWGCHRHPVPPPRCPQSTSGWTNG